jgi:hypothetical protein
MNRIRYYLHTLITLVTGALCVGCSDHDCHVHDEPEEVRVGVEVDVLFKFTDLPLYQEIVIPESRSDDGSEDGSTYIRYIIKVYRDDAANRVPISTYSFYRPLTDSLDFEAKINVPTGKISCMVWADYVDAGNPMADRYYSADNFQEILLIGQDSHPGNTDLRDAFRGSATATVGSDTDKIVIEMARPLAKYEFIATDLEEFMASAKRRSDYTVVVHYNGYMPCSYNMFLDKPADSRIGVNYSGKLPTSGTDGEVPLGFDYLFVNGSQASVSAYLEVQSSDGDVVSRTSPIDIPLIRGHLTTVKGRFLTSKTAGGTIISPDYDGSYNIFIH